LEDRALAFAKNIRSFIKKLRNTLANVEDGKQLIRSSGATGSNYIEANEALGKKDFIMRIKICRKEAKESMYWLKLLDMEGNLEMENERDKLLQEVKELMNIFVAILQKT